MANWFIKVGVTEQGPFLDAQLRKLALNGQLRSNMLVRREGSDRLVEAGLIKGLFPPVPPPPPIAPPAMQVANQSRPTTASAPDSLLSSDASSRLTSCPDCGKMISKSALSCPNCGRASSSKSRLTALLLAWTLGGLGIHKFYLGRTSEGVVYLLFCWTFLPAIAAFFDGISYLGMTDQRFSARYGSSNESTEAPPSIGVVLRWTFGVLILFSSVAQLGQPGGWIGASITGFIGLCLIPPSWNWMCGAPMARQVGYWSLTVLGALIVLTGLLAFVATPNNWMPAPFLTLAGLAMIPAGWEWLSRRLNRPVTAFNALRWCVGLSAIVIAGFVSKPDEAQTSTRHDMMHPRNTVGARA